MRENSIKLIYVVVTILPAGREVHVKRIFIGFALIVSFFASGCCSRSETSGQSVPVSSPGAAAPADKMQELRRRADLSEAASLVGYDGKAIKEDLHKILDAQQEQARRLKELENIR